MIQVSCPACRAVQSVPPQAAGYAIRCMTCGSTFQVPRPAAGPSGYGAAPSAPTPPVTPPPTTSPPQRTRKPGPTVSVGTTNSTGAVIEPVGGISKNLMHFVIGVVVFLVIGIVALLVHMASQGGPAAKDDDDAPQEVQWAVAPNESQQIGGVKVRIPSASYEILRGRDGLQQPIETEQNYLSIYLTVSNNSQDPVTYRSWYGPMRKRLEMTDDNDRRYEVFRMRRMMQVDGHVAESALFPGRSIEDRLVFIVPDSVDRSTIQEFQLILSASAAGEKGHYRFRIPRDVISGF